MREFIAGNIGYGVFRDRMARVMGPLDPLDLALQGLTNDQQEEAIMFVEWLGGEFGETEDRIPRKAAWVYGESEEPYGWVDEDEYRRALEAAFGEILGTGT